MNNRVLTAVSALLCTAALLAPTMRADAQCQPTDLFCAELRIGPAQPPPPPPPVVVEVPAPPPPPPPPPPPVVIVQPEAPPPPPPVVIVQPEAPPPPPRQVVVLQGEPPPPAQDMVVRRGCVVRYDVIPDFDLGVHLDVAGVMTENVSMAGLQGAFRIRPIAHLALDVGIGIFGGESRNYGPGSGDRVEVPFLLDVLFYFNPQSRFQVYALVGLGASWASQKVGLRSRDMGYVGGEAGLGLEWRLGRFFALNLDIRGFLRSHVSDGPEFTRLTASGRTQSTDLSGGFYGTLGMTFYVAN
jgi:hypothetical protein